MMNNPFLYSRNPYRDNPFTVLGIKDLGTDLAGLQYYVDDVEKYAAQDKECPRTGRKDKKGEAGRAMSCITSPVVRLACALICFGLVDYRGGPK